MQEREAELRVAERGVILLVVVFIAAAIAGLAAISSGRTISAARGQQVLEDEARAFNSAYAQLHLALNVINGSAYAADNTNVAIRDAIDGLHGGTVAGVDPRVDPLSVEAAGTATPRAAKPAGIGSGYVAKGDPGTRSRSLDKRSEADATWLDDPAGVEHGFIEGTNVRVYRGRDYIRRLAKLKGHDVSDVDPAGASGAFFVLEAAGRAGDTVRLVSALVRETEPFSSFVFFQNRATLGVSGSPRGLIHSNDRLAFYFPEGRYVDPVSAVNGFGYEAGATAGNTDLRDANGAANPISLDGIDFGAMKEKADVFVGTAGLDAELLFLGDGRVRIREYTKPRYETVTRSYTYDKQVGFHYETRTRDVQVQVGEVAVPYTVEETTGHRAETYTALERVLVGTRTERYREIERVQVGNRTEIRHRRKRVQTGTRPVTKTRQDPIHATRTVQKTRLVTKLVPLSEVDPNVGGGTVGGSGNTGIMVEVEVQETYTVQETYVAGYETVTWVEQEPVYEWVDEPYEVTVGVFVDRPVTRTRVVDVYEDQLVERTRQVPIIETVTKTRMDPVFETRTEEYQTRVDDYETTTVTWEEEVFVAPERQSETFVELNNDAGGTIYVDGRITALEGDVNGRVTVVGNEGARVTGNLRYVDGDGDYAMTGGTDPSWAARYERNASYDGKSVLGLVTRDDIVFTRSLPEWAEVDGSLMSVEGRVGIDGFVTTPEGDVVKSTRKNRAAHLTPEQQEQWRAYARTRYRERRFKKSSLRRIGGTISNNRILETYIRMKGGAASVDSGFTSGNMLFDINLLFNPPPNFVQVPRPAVTSFVPVFLQANSN